MTDVFYVDEHGLGEDWIKSTGSGWDLGYSWDEFAEWLDNSGLGEDRKEAFLEFLKLPASLSIPKDLFATALDELEITL